MLLNCGVGEDSWESLGLQGDPTSPSTQISPGCSLDGLMLKLQYLGHLMWRAASLENTLMLGKTEGKRMRRQRRWWLDSITDSMDIILSTLGASKGKGSLACCSPQGTMCRTRLSNWTTIRKFKNPMWQTVSSEFYHPMVLLIWRESRVKFMGALVTKILAIQKTNGIHVGC